MDALTRVRSQARAASNQGSGVAAWEARAQVHSPIAAAYTAATPTNSRPVTAASQEPHDRLVAHQLALREEVANGGHQPAFGVHGEGDLEPGSPVAWRMGRIEVAQGRSRLVQGDHDVAFAGGAAELVEVSRRVPDEPAIEGITARDLADEELEGRLLHSERTSGHELELPESGCRGEASPARDHDRMLRRPRPGVVGHERVVVHDEVAGGHAVGGEAGRAVGDGLEGLPGADPAALEPLLEQREDAGEERGAAHEQDVVDRSGGDAG